MHATKGEGRHTPEGTCFCLVALGIEPRVLYMLAKHSAEGGTSRWFVGDKFPVV